MILEMSNINKNKNRNYEIARVYDWFLSSAKIKDIEINFNFNIFYDFYNFFVKINDEKRIDWFLKLDKNYLILFLNKLFELETKIKEGFYSYFYNVESNINRNLELMLFRYFFNNEATNDKEILEQEKILEEIIYEKKYKNNNEKLKLFKKISATFPFYNFESKESFNEYIEKWKKLSDLRNQVMHPNSIEKLFNDNKITNLIHLETRKEWNDKILNLFKDFKINNKSIFLVYIDKLENDFINFIDI